jgi:hypothetical protein
MKEYLSNYIGVVVQNNDPEMRGRIKVFIPNVSTNIHQDWDSDTDDKIFNFVDNTDIQKILDNLKQVLPWAEYAGPIFGGCASARYNASLKKGVVSDTNLFEGGEPIEGYRPSTMYNNELAYPDAFSATGKVGNKNVNPYAYQYIPSNYSNLARGMFSIPNVGSHVWVWFIGGDPNYPVYFASAYGEEDIKRIYTNSQKTGLKGDEASSLHYPGAYENKNEVSPDSQFFRSKHVINSNKNTIEMIDSDGLESIKFTHHSGSFQEMNNETSIKLSTGNDQTMVLGETFETFQKEKNEFIGGTSDIIIHGDFYEKIGNQNAESIKQIYEKYKNIHDYKSLFDIKRTQDNKAGEAFDGNVTSPYQLQSGKYNICPVCKSTPYFQKIWFLNPIHNKIILPIPTPYPGLPSLSIFTPVPAPFLAINNLVGYINGRECPLCNRFATRYSYQTDHTLGFSPSTHDGFWDIDTNKQVDGALGDLYKSFSSEIIDLQNNLGEGGDKINNISRNFVLNVGLVMNNLQSYRVDARGKLESHAVYLSPEGALVEPEPTPHVEHVDVDSLPGGDFIVTAGNKMKFLVGSNGINIKTFGPIEMYGSITNLTSEQMNILTKHELFIDGGEKLSLRSRNITLNPFEQNPVLIDGQLHVTGNSVIKGGMHIDGELSVQHITGPSQWYETEDGGGLTMLTETLPNIPTKPPVPPHIHKIILRIPDHKHYYLNLPMDLKSCKEEARSTMIELGINANKPVASQPIKYPNTVTGLIDSPIPSGAIMGIFEATQSLETNGIGFEAVNAISDTLVEAGDVTDLNSIYASFSTSSDAVGVIIQNATDVYNDTVNSDLKAVEEALENIFLT